LSELKSAIKADAIFAQHHALKSATILHHLAELLVPANSDEEALAILRSKKSAIIPSADSAFLEEGLINFYLKSAGSNEEK
jgi:hypothetical protein